MCNPAVIPLVLTMFSTVAQVRSDESKAHYQKGVDDYNARITENRAEETRAEGVEAENAQRLRTAQLLSRQRAQLGASGIDAGSGSALQLQQDTMTLGEADALRIRSNTSSKVGALGEQVSLTKSHGEAAVIAGKNSMTGSLLSGASSIMDSGVSDKWFTSDSAGAK